jgi:hypothetical protein
VRKHLHTVVDIDRPPQEVWPTLTDFASYPRWNPFIVEADGTASVGARLTLRMQPIGARAVTLTPIVEQVVNERRLQWVGRLAIPGLLTARHTFTLEPREGGSRLVQEETFTGLLAPLIGRSLDRHTLPAFAAMNAALREEVERRTRPTPRT